jgi:hypothetical protein
MEMVAEFVGGGVLNPLRCWIEATIGFQGLNLKVLMARFGGSRAGVS